MGRKEKILIIICAVCLMAGCTVHNGAKPMEASNMPTSLAQVTEDSLPPPVILDNQGIQNTKTIGDTVDSLTTSPESQPIDVPLCEEIKEPVSDSGTVFYDTVTAAINRLKAKGWEAEEFSYFANDNTGFDFREDQVNTLPSLQEVFPGNLVCPGFRFSSN